MRSIQSPGVEIREYDLSLNASLPNGTNVFVQGFADQGPTDELLNVTSMSELEQIYGMPTTAAERYFYHTARRVIESPGNLLTTRLPYGSGDGDGYAGYSALIYPMSASVVSSETATTNQTVASYLFDTITSATSGLTYSGTINLPTTYSSPSALSGLEVTVEGDFGPLDASIILSESVQGILSASNFAVSGTVDASALTSIDFTLDFTNEADAWPGSEGLTVGTKIYAGYDYSAQISAGTYTPASTFEAGNKYEIAEPILVGLNEAQYQAWESGNISWETTYSEITGSSDAEIIAQAGKAGMIVVNKAKTVLNELREGYYVALTDNQNIGDKDAVENVKFINTTTGEWAVLPTTVLETAISGDNSASDYLESIANFDGFTTEEYDDSIVLQVYKIRETVFGSSTKKTLAISPMESFIGSMDYHRKEVNPNTSAEENYFIAERINENSNYIGMHVNPYISSEYGSTWAAGGTDTTPSKDVRVTDEVKNIFAESPILEASDSNKDIGNMVTKLERSFRLAENKDLVPIDLVTDGGLSTIWSYVMDGISDGDTAGSFIDSQYLNIDPLYDSDASVATASDVSQNWTTITNAFVKFCGSTRKDCMFISDPLRAIFIQGTKSKVLDNKTYNFSQHVHKPLKNLYSTVNSNYAAAYGNWVKRYDNELGQFVWLPFSGYQSNIFCNLDSQLQPWYAGAGLNNGVVRDIVDIAINPTLKQRDLLYKSSINPVVFFPGDGYVVWGQKTLQKKPSAFDRINVRRLFLVMEKATLAIMRYFVFEPNTVFTRTRVNNVLSPIFDVAKNNEGMYDYKIICDERNNTSDVIDNNEMVVDIYIKPTRIAEFILVNFYATRTDQNFNELL